MSTNVGSMYRHSRLSLLRAGIHVFARKGFEGAGIREIASLAGVNSSLIFYHFRSKEGFYRAILRYAGRLARQIVKSLPEVPAARERDVQQKVMAGLQAHMGMFIRTGLGGRDQDHRNGNPALGKTLLALLRRAVSDPRPGTEGVLLEAIQPSLDYLCRCIHVLSPDLDDERRLGLALAIQAQETCLGGAMELLRLASDGSSFRGDLPGLIHVCIDFNLRGISAGGGSACARANSTTDLSRRAPCVHV